MKLTVIVHEAEEGGYWAEVPSIPGCATQGDTFDELLQNLYEATAGCLAVDVDSLPNLENFWPNSRVFPNYRGNFPGTFGSAGEMVRIPLTASELSPDF